RDVAAAPVDLVNFRRIDVEPDDVKSAACELDRERQADVSKTNDADPRLLCPDSIQQRGEGGHNWETRSLTCGVLPTRAMSASTTWHGRNRPRTPSPDARRGYRGATYRRCRA